MTTPELPAGETAGAQTLRRGLSILKLLARHQPEGLRIGEIGRRLGLSKATAVRLTPWSSATASYGMPYRPQ